MREINASLTATSVTSIDGLRDENAYIEAQTDLAESACLSGGTLTGLAGYDTVIRCRCISRLLVRNGLPVSHDRIRECEHILINGGKLNISGDIYFVSDGSAAQLKTLPAKTEPELLSIPLKIGENSMFSGVKLICELKECSSGADVNKKLTFYALDYDKIKGGAVLRNRRNGDRIQLRGRDFRSSVKKLINEKIPPGDRSTLHFIEDDEGTIFAERLGIAQRVAPDGDTRRLLTVTVVRDEQDRSGSFDTKKK
jgi:tRNA(Ile)-lysidine synthase